MASGYTAGIGKHLSELSMSYGINANVESLKEITFDSIKGALEWYFNLDDEEMKLIVDTLLDKAYVDYDIIDDIEIEDVYDIELNRDTSELIINNSWIETFNELSQGDLRYYISGDKETVLGVEMGAAGEHIGSVSVYVDTYREEIRQDGKTYPMSSTDCDELNEIAEELFND